MRPRRREELREPDNYMTLTQLEDMWLTKDVFAGSVSTPTPPPPIPGYNMDKSLSATLGVRYPPTYISSPSPRDSEPDDNVVGGIVHPALRPIWTPSLDVSRWASEDSSSPMDRIPSYQQLHDSAWLSRSAVDVPSASWTYGRR